MDEPYLPKSDFIMMVVNGDAPLTGNAFADQNLRLLITLMKDADLSNRDWATMTLASRDSDTPEVRSALLSALDDDDCIVRAEALQGLAERGPTLALPLLQCEMAKAECGYAVFQAAYSVAHPDLLEGLRKWHGRGGVAWIDGAIRDAIIACESRLVGET